MSLQPCMTFSSLKHTKKEEIAQLCFLSIQESMGYRVVLDPTDFHCMDKNILHNNFFCVCKRKTVIEVWNDKNTFYIIIYIIIVYSNLWFDHRWIKITDFLLWVNFPLKYPSPFTAMVLIRGCFKISLIIFCYLIRSKIFEKYSNCTIWL